MKASIRVALIAGLCVCGLTLPLAVTASTPDLDNPIANCLKAWGDHPFGDKPQFKTVPMSVKVFGLGSQAADTEKTGAPVLVLVEPSVNLAGSSTIELMNPNGWYCMRTTISVLGNVNVRAHCKAHLAATSAGSTAVGNNVESRTLRDLAVSTLGSVRVERPCD